MTALLRVGTTEPMLIFGLAFSNSLMQGKRGRPMRYSAFVEDRPTLSAVVSRIQEISTLPHVAMHIMQVAGKPDCGVTELTAALEADASLSARVLRCVNSAAYAVRVRVTNLQMAVAYLGTKQIRNLALTASISDLFLENEAIGPYRRSELWRHLVSVGLCARMIAMRRKVAAFEDAFLAGLLHDIGIVLEDQYLHKQFAGMIAALDGKKTLAETERSHFDFDHMILGGMVAENWRFPEVVRVAIRYHHLVPPENVPAEILQIVHCVALANLICTLKGISSVGIKVVENCAHAVNALSLTAADVAVMAADLDDTLAANSALFQVGA
jgi:HD-like signal output (HDOD) protein